MVKKTIKFDIYIKTSEQTPTYSYVANQKVMSNDKNSTQITFNLLDVPPEELSGSSASILLYMQDGSFFQSSDVTIDRNSVIYTMKEEETKHSGNTKVQIVLKKGTVQTASLIYNFEIEKGLEKYPITEVMIQDWTTLTEEAKAFVEQIEGFNLEQFVENKMGEELANLETNYATRLTGLEQKDNQITAQLAQKVGGGKLASLNDLDGEVISAIEGGEGTSFNLLSIPQNRSVTPEKTTFIEQSSNLFNKDDIVLDKRIGQDGTVNDATNFAVSGYFPVSGGSELTTSGHYEMAFYDDKYTFLRRLYNFDPPNTYTFTVPNGAFFARANIRYNLPSWPVDVIQINSGSELLPYEPYHQKLDGIKVGADNLEPNSVTTDNLALNSVGTENAKFIKTGLNLLDRSKESANTLISDEGVVTTNSEYATSDFIPTTPTSDFSTRGVYNVSWYDSDKNFIKRDETANYADGKFTAPSSAYYMRGGYKTATVHIKSAQINIGETLLPYEPYYEKLEKILVGQDNLEPESVLSNNVKQGAITPDKTSFIKESTNLFNKDDVELDKRIGPDGTINDATTYVVSGYFPVSGGSELATNGIYEMAFYDDKYNFLSRIQSTNIPNYFKFIVPNNAFYARANVRYTSAQWRDSKIQINEGNELKPYADYHLVFTKESGLSKLNRIVAEDMMDRNDSYMIDVPVDGAFQTQKTFPDYTNFRESTHTDVYGIYDELEVSYPEYITSEVIGHDVRDNEIKMYHFKPAQPSSDKPTKIPKVFLITGTHGKEKATVPSTYHMFKMMCENWKDYPLLEALRFNVEWLYIPVANPSGWDRNLRGNADGVDINRNFPYKWTKTEEGTHTYSGPYVLSEPEAQAINSIFDEHKDIDIVCDFHNFGPETVSVVGGVFTGTNRFLWVLTEDVPYVQHMGQNLVSRLSRRWEDDFDWYANNQFAGHTSAKDGGPGLIQSYASSLEHIKFSSTLEICNTWAINPDGVSNGDDVIKAGVESITNWMLIQLKELIK